MENGEWTVGKITNGFFKLFYRCVMDVLRFNSCAFLHILHLGQEI